MYFGAERRGQGEVEGTSWRHWPDHVRYLSYVIDMKFLITSSYDQDTLREQGSRV